MFADKEINLIEWLQDVQDNEILIYPKTDEMINMFKTVHDKKLWQNWINSSGKSDPPPDFYSDKYCLMMDVMRIDDHAYKNAKGKLVNPSLMHEKELYKELLNSGILNNFNSDIKTFTIGDTCLPSYEDHNYIYYYRNFSRIIKKHIDNIPLYLQNHPNYKVVFMVFDESTAYLQLYNGIAKEVKAEKGAFVNGEPHFFFLDNRFLNNFVNSNVDYLIWYSPYKRFEAIGEAPELPKVCVLDLSKKIIGTIDYEENKMMSNEI